VPVAAVGWAASIPGWCSAYAEVHEDRGAAVQEQLMVGCRVRSIVFDCARPSALARFWAAALTGYAIRPYDEAEIARLRAVGIEDLEDDPTVVIDPPTPDGPTIFFVKVPEPKTTKNRVHLDLDPESTMETEVERLVALGARRQAVVDEPHGRWTALLDPEGNEFDVMDLAPR
jgi:hypothetical protein